MTCRHHEGDERCTSGNAPQDLYNKGKELVDEWGPVLGLGDSRPDSEKFQILDSLVHEDKLILKVKYPSCPSCTYEGIKIMVFVGVTLSDAIKWTKIDPHFRDPMLKGYPTDAPSPIARFPGTNWGWDAATKFVVDMLPYGRD